MSAPAGSTSYDGPPPGRDVHISDSLSELMPSIDPPYPGWHRPAPGPVGRRADLVAAIALCVAAVITMPLYPWAGLASPTHAPLWLELIWSAVLTVPLIWRRQHPNLVALIVAAAFLAGGIAFGVSLFFHNIALFVAFYTVGAWEPNRQRARWTRLLIMAGMFAWLIIAIFIYATRPMTDAPAQTGPFSPFVSIALIQLLTNATFFVGAYYLGNRSYAQAIEQDTLLRRTQELAEERARSTRQAIMLERLRIARELHDVVAHHVSVMGVQAGAARLALDRSPDTSRVALDQIESSARDAIEELRGILGTLRDEPGTPDQSKINSAPTIGVQRLDELVQQLIMDGMPVRLEVIGEPRPLPSVTDLNIYRITQEALTNVRKHAGPRATADVRLRYYPDEVEIEISNSGSQRPTRGNGTGLGQQGIRERVAASGGTVELGPLQRGGYLVRARMPLPRPTGSRP
ncbi:sensor histidine kinase [Microlunatus elymi]|uniref:histidine kinase n=1 Tax=Microlunatus elymi TaxID=2596828 RepID=A0A516PVC9_9ACTN|nr:sensor histidine kinase [Microlunatus elymi]QDP95110.1 sensor histidine kinase [Microlunatus elymi]